MLPQFLGIGTQKAGTTWLYHNLSYHSGVWLPPLKELFYFCPLGMTELESDLRPSRWPMALQLLQPRRTLLRSLAGRAAQQVAGRMIPRRARNSAPAAESEPRAAAEVPPPDVAVAPPPPRPMSRAAELRWYLRYTLLPRTDRWYASLFRAAPGQIAGDITPYYANLGDRQVARIHALLPDVKVIYLLRDPIARMWSEAAMTIRQYGNSVGATESAVLRRYFENRSQSRLTDYVGNLERWRRHFPSEQIFVGFFDDLERDPRALLRSIFTFLGVDASARHIATDVGARRNAGREKEIPSEWASCMAELFLPRIRQAHQYFDNAHTARWLAEAEGHLAKTTE